MSVIQCLATGFREKLRPALERFPLDPVLLLMRVIIGTVFLLSAMTKVEGFGLAESTYALFQYEYALPFIPYELAAWMATIGEWTFSLMVLAGVGTRLAALGMLGMTAVIQIFVYPDAWVTHGLWASSLLVLILRGPGVVSVDALIEMTCRKARV